MGDLFFNTLIQYVQAIIFYNPCKGISSVVLVANSDTTKKFMSAPNISSYKTGSIRDVCLFIINMHKTLSTCNVRFIPQ